MSNCEGHELFSVVLATSHKHGECVGMVDNTTGRMFLALPKTVARQVAASMLNVTDLLELPFEQRAEAARRMGYKDGDV